MKILKSNNKGILIFDSVRFITSVESQRFSLSLLRELEDYRVIITHGVIGELINIIENLNYGIDKNKLSLLINNTETAKLFNSYGYRTYDISEYIFTDDDRYNILNKEKTYDCIFPGRATKGIGLFKKEYTSKVNILYKTNDYPVRSENMSKLFNQAKTGLMTTESEGSCLSVGEMLSCGIPVVSVKINNTASKSTYYPVNKRGIASTYGTILPHTLGGRELWLDSSNSIYCDRTDDSIDGSIQTLISKNLTSLLIRENFLAKLSQHRLKFLYLIKSLLEELDLDFNSIDLENFINLPYGNSTVNSSNWKATFNHFKTSYIQ